MTHEVLKHPAAMPAVETAEVLKEKPRFRFSNGFILLDGETIIPSVNLRETELELIRMAKSHKKRKFAVRNFYRRNNEPGSIHIDDLLNSFPPDTHVNYKYLSKIRFYAQELTKQFTHYIGLGIEKKKPFGKQEKYHGGRTRLIPKVICRLHIWRYEVRKYLKKEGVNLNMGIGNLNSIFKKKNFWVLLTYPTRKDSVATSLFVLAEIARGSRFSPLTKKRDKYLDAIRQLSNVYCQKKARPIQSFTDSNTVNTDELEYYRSRAIKNEPLSSDEEKTLFREFECAKTIQDFFVHNGLIPVIKDFKVVAFKRRQNANEETKIWTIEEFKKISDGKTSNLIDWLNYGLSIKNIIYLSNTRLVFEYAKFHIQKGVPLIDIISAGNQGLQRAIELFDVSRGNKFSTYAVKAIERKMERCLASYSRNIMSLRSYLDRTRLMAVYNRINIENKSPSIAELARITKMPERRVKRLLEINRNETYTLLEDLRTSSDRPIDEEIGDGMTNIPDILIEKEEREEKNELVQRILDTSLLDEQALDIIIDHLAHGLSFKTIGDKYDKSGEWARGIFLDAKPKFKETASIQSHRQGPTLKM